MVSSLALVLLASVLRAPCDEYIATLKHAASSRVLALTRRTSQQRARKQHAAKAQFTFAPPRWKLSPSCALDVNDRSDHVASLSTCTTTCMPSPAPASLRATETAPRGTLGSCFRSRRLVDVTV